MPQATNAVVALIDLRESAVLLDVDGTVLDLAATPGAVEVPAALKQVLARLSEGAGGAVAFVSGRRIVDLDAIFVPMKLPCVGAHGAEVRLADGSVRHFAEPLPAELVAQLAELVADHPGLLLEDKGYAAAVHYRLAPDLEAMIASKVRDLCGGFMDRRIEILPGKSVIEVKQSIFNKGTGVRELMRHPPFVGRKPIFIGDDVTDEPCFDVVNEFGGAGFSVGRDMAGAVGRFQSPEEVRQWLSRLASEVRS